MASRMASKTASDVLVFGPRHFVVCPTSLPSRQATQTAIPVGVPSLSFGYNGMLSDPLESDVGTPQSYINAY